jgi:hypothetical protein
MNECEVTDLKIEQGEIQMKGVHLLYQLQVISGNVKIEVAPTRPRKWLTQSPFGLSIWQNHYNSQNQNHHCKTSLIQSLQLVVFVQNPSIMFIGPILINRD